MYMCLYGYTHTHIFILIPSPSLSHTHKLIFGNTPIISIISSGILCTQKCVYIVIYMDNIPATNSDVYPQNNPPTIVRERVLGLIQYWADAFKNKPELAGVQELYQQMKDDGTEFPPVDLDSLAPVELPERVGYYTCACTFIVCIFVNFALMPAFHELVQ